MLSKSKHKVLQGSEYIRTSRWFKRFFMLQPTNLKGNALFAENPPTTGSLGRALSSFYFGYILRLAYMKPFIKSIETWVPPPTHWHRLFPTPILMRTDRKKFNKNEIKTKTKQYQEQVCKVNSDKKRCFKCCNPRI